MLTESVSCAFYLHDEYTEFRAYELTIYIFFIEHSKKTRVQIIHTFW